VSAILPRVSTVRASISACPAKGLKVAGTIAHFGHTSNEPAATVTRSESMHRHQSYFPFFSDARPSFGDWKTGQQRKVSE